jgi:hypothetical protein
MIIAMKNFFRLLILLLLSQQLCQAQMQYSGNDGAMRFFEMRDDQGALIKTASEMGVKGSPMIGNRNHSFQKRLTVP